MCSSFCLYFHFIPFHFPEFYFLKVRIVLFNHGETKQWTLFSSFFHFISSTKYWIKNSSYTRAIEIGWKNENGEQENNENGIWCTCEPFIIWIQGNVSLLAMVTTFTGVTCDLYVCGITSANVVGDSFCGFVGTLKTEWKFKSNKMYRKVHVSTRMH